MKPKLTSRNDLCVACFGCIGCAGCTPFSTIFIFSTMGANTVLIGDR